MTVSAHGRSHGQSGGGGSGEHLELKDLEALIPLDVSVIQAMKRK